MKFLYSAILALAATGAQAQNANPQTISSATELEDAWNMDNAAIQYDTNSNKFTLTFATTDVASQFDSDIHINEEFYDSDCADQDGTGENVIAAGIVDPDNNLLRPQAVQDSSTGAITLDFELLPKILSTNTDIYETDGAGTGTLNFCVRTSLGYNGDGTAVTGRAKNRQEQINAGFVEVNFIESLITVVYDLTSGFATVNANVKPKERVGQTDSEEAYGLEAWICDKSSTSPHTYPVGDGTTITRTYPDDLVYTFFNQGALIPVCIRPSDIAYGEGVVMKELVDFTWTRPGTPVYGNVQQQAIVTTAGVSAVSDNRLTFHNTCVGADYCLLESVLFADFYVTQGIVNGQGTALVKFDGTRRLADSRKLQESEEGSPFDVAIPLAGDQDGPGAIKTAGGVSLGLTALASAVALASAGLMA